MDDKADFRSVRPVRPAAGYVGGKKLLAAAIIERIATTPHEIYAEAFVGMGGVFLRRPTAPKIEVINDRSKDVATFFRVLQRHFQAFMDMLKWQLTSRAEFDRLRATDPETLTDLERAARFLYLQKLAFGGKVAGRNFGVQTTGPARFDPRNLTTVLEAIHERLAGVTIECLDWRDFLDRWDRPGALFYLDPPYLGAEDFYGKGLFPPADHRALASVLRRLEGRFILTMNDTKDARAIYGGFAVETAELAYSIRGGEHRKAVREIIVSGGGRRRP